MWMCACLEICIDRFILNRSIGLIICIRRKTISMATKYKCPMTVSATKKALPSPKSLLVNKPISSDLQCEDEK